VRPRVSDGPSRLGPAADVPRGGKNSARRRSSAILRLCASARSCGQVGGVPRAICPRGGRVHKPKGRLPCRAIRCLWQGSAGPVRRPRGAILQARVRDVLGVGLTQRRDTDWPRLLQILCRGRIAADFPRGGHRVFAPCQPSLAQGHGLHCHIRRATQRRAAGPNTRTAQRAWSAAGAGRVPTACIRRARSAVNYRPAVAGPGRFGEGGQMPPQGVAGPPLRLSVRPKAGWRIARQKSAKRRSNSAYQLRPACVLAVSPCSVPVSIVLADPTRPLSAASGKIVSGAISGLQPARPRLLRHKPQVLLAIACECLACGEVSTWPAPCLSAFRLPSHRFAALLQAACRGGSRHGAADSQIFAAGSFAVFRLPSFVPRPRLWNASRFAAAALQLRPQPPPSSGAFASTNSILPDRPLARMEFQPCSHACRSVEAPQTSRHNLPAPAPASAPCIYCFRAGPDACRLCRLGPLAVSVQRPHSTPLAWQLGAGSALVRRVQKVIARAQGDPVKQGASQAQNRVDLPRLRVEPKIT